jgi:putative hydrolase of the HAD superfamily
VSVLSDDEGPGAIDIKAIAFDVNGTLVDIITDDGSDEAFRASGHFLSYQGIDIRRHDLRNLYFQILKEQQAASPEEHPEFDAVAIWRRIIDDHATAFTDALPAEKRSQLPTVLAEMYRGITRRRLRLYPHVRSVLDALRSRYPLAVVTDGQSAWAPAELNRVGLRGYFDPLIVSGDFGYRKPDARLFLGAADRLGVAPGQILYVGNDMYRDIFGARRAGMKTALFRSEHGAKEHEECIPDWIIDDHRALLDLL